MKKGMIALAAFVVILIAGVLVAPSFIDWSKYRAEIAAQVKQTIGRDLVIGGEINFSILPSPVLSAGDIRLSNAQTGLNPDMVHMRQLDVQVALFPLLSGHLNIQSIRLIEPEIHLEILTNGQGNWVFTDPSKPDNPENSSPTGTGDFAPSARDADTNALPLEIEQFLIENANVFFTDHTTGRQEEIKELDARFSLAGLSGPFEAAGTLVYGSIPLGFEATVGQIVNNRSASFAGLIRTAHGQSETRISGTAINQSDGPRLNAKISSKGDSLAELLSAFVAPQGLSIALDRPFTLETILNYQSDAVSLGENGLDFQLGEDHITVLGDARLGEAPAFNVATRIKRIDADRWLVPEKFQAKPLTPLSPVLERTALDTPQRGDKVSTSLSAPPNEEAALNDTPSASSAFHIPPEIRGQFSAEIDALLLKGDSIRQIRTNLSLEGGEIALERLSAVLPGAGDLNVFGVAGMTENGFGFDGSLDLNFALLRKALQWAGLDVQNLPQDRLQQLNLNAQLAGTSNALEISGLNVVMDATKLSGGALLEWAGTPKISADLQIDRINLDKYLLSPAQKSAPQTAEQNPDPNGSPSSSQETAVNPQGPALPSLDFLTALNADLALRLANLRYQGQDVKGITLRSQIQDGQAEFNGTQITDLAGLQLSLGGGLKPQAGSLEFENLFLNVKGKSAQKVLALLNMQEKINARQLGRLDLSAQLNGPFLKPDLNVTSAFSQGTFSLNGQADLFPLPQITGKLNIDAAQFQSLLSAFVPTYRPRGPLDLKADVALAASAQQVRLENLNARINGTPIEGQIRADLGTRPNIVGDLRTGRLNLSPLLAVETASPQQTQRSSGTSNRPRPSQGSSGAAANGSRWSTDPLDVSVLQTMEANFTLNSEALILDKIIANQLNVKAELKDGVLSIDQKTANLFGGPLASVTRINSTPTLQIATDITSGSMNLGQALQQLTGKKQAEGQITLRSNLTTQGGSQRDLVRNLNGQFSSSLSKVNATLDKGNPALQLFQLLSTLSGRNPSQGLADISINSAIENGVARLTNAGLASGVANGNATGQLDLNNWLVDISGTVKVAQTALVGLIAQQTKMKSDYPFSVRGALDNPNIKLDTGGIESGGGLIIPIPEQLDRKGVGNLLRGVLGGAGFKSSPQETQPSQPSANPPASPPAPSPQPARTLAPPPPPPGGGSNTQNRPPSVEQQLLQGLGTILQGR